jgi:hypothetical protein
MLKSEHKEVLILCAFSLFLREYLTMATMVFVFFGALLIFFKKKPTKLVRNALALLIFGSYWFSYGKVIDPEVGLNFLTSVIVLKILERETKRDQYMIFFGLILIISAGSLFEKTLSFVIFYALSFLILIQDFYENVGLRWRKREIGLALLWVLPFTIAFFVLVPRMMNPISMNQSKQSAGEVGFTPNLNVSEIETLNGNDTAVFQAEVSRTIPNESLYWRGNSIAFTDGWNWVAGGNNHGQELPITSWRSPETNELLQSFRTFTREDFFFALDQPVLLKTADSVFEFKETKTLSQKRWSWAQRYEVISRPSFVPEVEGKERTYLRTSLSKADRSWINQRFVGTTASEVALEVSTYFREQRFSYTYSPGKITTFMQFMTTAKTGFCSHYASALAQILRVKNIPSRLVSGFLGGRLNSFANFYVITQNDAHVWVEAHDGERWIRLDPTTWIAPDRITLGGEAFMENVKGTAEPRLENIPGLAWLYDARQWFEQWDFKFYSWLEDLDYEQQEAWFKKWNFKRRWLFFVIPMMLVIFLGVYSLKLLKESRGNKRGQLNELWGLFEKKMMKKGLTLKFHSIEETQRSLLSYTGKDKEDVLKAWRSLIELSFEAQSKESIRDIKAAITKL